MKNKMIATESFRSGKDIYFFDYLIAVNGRHYIRIARMEKQLDGTIERSKVVIFEDIIQPMISALSFLLGSAAHQDQDDWTLQDTYQDICAKRLDVPINWQAGMRERLGVYGAGGLNNRELLALVLGCGTAVDPSLEIADEIMNILGEDIGRLSSLTQADLCTLKGIGAAKSSAILASVELGRRAFESAPISGGTNWLRFG